MEQLNRKEALAFYRTLPEKEIRRRQDLCTQQTARAFQQRNEEALKNLQAMSDALVMAMLERLDHCDRGLA